MKSLLSPRNLVMVVASVATLFLLGTFVFLHSPETVQVLEITGSTSTKVVNSRTVHKEQQPANPQQFAPPRLRNQPTKLFDLRSRPILLGNAISNIDSIFSNLSSLCGAAPGFVRCSKSRGRSGNSNNNRSFDAAPSSASVSSSSSGCCCSWNPSSRSCSGPFNRTNTLLLNSVIRAHFVHTPTSAFIPNVELASKACPWFDRGTWNLPDNFLDQSFDEAAVSSATASAAGAAATDEDVEAEKTHRRNVGPLFVWKLARELRNLNSKMVNVSNTKVQSSTQEANQSQNEKQQEEPTEKYNAPGMLLIAGDSIVRQVFARLLHTVRSRECSDTNEMFRGGVFERYFHLSAGYVVTTKGDALILDWPACEQVAAEPATSSFIPGRVLLRVCYVWDNSADATFAKFGTEFAIVKLGALTHISSVIYWPTMHHCNYVGGNCGNANMSNGAVLTVVAAATRFGIPRVLAATSIMRQWYPYYATEIISERNEQLKNMFRTDMWTNGVAALLDEKIMGWWRKRSQPKSNSSTSSSSQTSFQQPEPIETSLYSAMGPKGSLGWRFRLYDFANRHIDLNPRQCDHGHSMCMFWPLRLSPKMRFPVNGMSGVCPNGSRCEDPWNFLFLHEVLASMFA